MDTSEITLDTSEITLDTSEITHIPEITLDTSEISTTSVALPIQDLLSGDGLCERCGGQFSQTPFSQTCSKIDARAQ